MAVRDKPVKVEGVDKVARRLKRLPRDLSSRAGGPLKRALSRAAKRTVLAEAKARAPTGRTGNLRRSLTLRRTPDSGQSVERVQIHHRPKIAYYGHMVERGTVKMAAQPHLGPAFDSEADNFIATFSREFREEVDKAVRKLNKRGGR